MIRISRTALMIGSLLLLAGGAPVAMAEEEQLEEVVITGSYIKRDSFDSASPLQVIDQTDISLNATPALGEVLANQTFNYGSDMVTNTFATRGQGGVATSANLRGLGGGATLDLIDGHRTTQSNLNNQIPQIAISRIDILKDGASALYGSDAVAGVVNIITRKDFTGFELGYFYTQDSQDDHYENVAEFIMGGDIDNGHAVLAGSYRRRTTLQMVDRPKLLRGSFSRSGTGNPGRWNVPTRDAAGQLTGSSVVQTDPGCGAYDGPSGADVALKGNRKSGWVQGTVCRFEFGEFWNYMNPNEQLTFMFDYQYDFTDNLHYNFDITYSRQITGSRGSPQNPGGRTEEFPDVLGDHPGNPWRAFYDADADGVIDDGERLFAADIDGNGVPDRNRYGVVQLAAAPFDPTSGIAFNEDVDVIALRAFGKLGRKPNSFHADGSNSGNSSYDSYNYMITNSLRYEIPDTNWAFEGYALFQHEHLEFFQKNTSQTALLAGLVGDLGFNNDEYWNPFSTQELTCVDRICTKQATAQYENSRAVVEAVNIAEADFFLEDFWVLEGVFTGELIELPAGALSAAFGIQYVEYTAENDDGSARNRCDWHEGGCAFDWKLSQDSYAPFFELSIPVSDGGSLGDMEVQLAGRYTDYGAGIDSFDPKIAVLWHPIDILSLRGSYSTAFIAPSLNELNQPPTCGLQTMNDPLTSDFENSFRVNCRTGNPNLVPESADVFNIGASVALLDGDLTIGIDYASYDFEDRISSPAGQTVIDADFEAFEAQGGDVTSAASVNAWINGAANPLIERDITGVITKISTGFVNAQSMKHISWDLYATYNLSVDNYGDFRFGLDATLVKEFSFNLGFGAGTGDGAGKQNELIAEIPPLPDWKINGTVNWSMANHKAMVRVRWVDDLEETRYFSAPTRRTLDSIVYVDLTYGYTFEGLLGGDRQTRFEVGGRNIFDEFPEPIFNLGGIESFIHDPRGRTYFLRLNQDI